MTRRVPGRPGAARSALADDDVRDHCPDGKKRDADRCVQQVNGHGGFSQRKRSYRLHARRFIRGQFCSSAETADRCTTMPSGRANALTGKAAPASGIYRTRRRVAAIARGGGAGFRAFRPQLRCRCPRPPALAGPQFVTITRFDAKPPIAFTPNESATDSRRRHRSGHDLFGCRAA